MRIKKKQLYLIIENLLLEQEQEDTGIVDTAVSAGEEMLRDPLLGNMGPELDIIEKSREIDDSSLPSVERLVSIIKDFSTYLKDDGDAQRKWAGLLGAAGSGGGVAVALGELGSGAALIGELSVATGIPVAELFVADAIAGLATAAAFEALLVAYGATKAAQLFTTAAQTLATNIQMQARVASVQNRKILMKMFTEGVKKAKSAGVGKAQLKKAHSEMLTFLEGNAVNALNLMVVLSFIESKDVRLATEELRNFESDYGIGGSWSDRSLLGTQMRMIGLIKKSKRVIEEINNKGIEDILSTIEAFKNTV